MATGVEAAALRVGSAVVRRLATRWLAAREADGRRDADLVELIAFRFSGLRERDRRGLRRKLDEIGDNVGERLQDLVDHEFRGLPDNERAAALDGVVDALIEADLSDVALLRNDLEPRQLANEVRRNIPSAKRQAGLSEAASALFDLTLDQACLQLVHLVRELPEYDGRLAEESLRRATNVLAGVDQILDRIPVTSLDAPGGSNHDDHFRRRYLDLVATHYDDLELIGVSVRNFRPCTKLSVAYLSLTVNQTGGSHHQQAHDMPAEHWFGSASYGESNTVRVEAALSTSDRTLIRGEAGSGKTTLLRWLAVTAARGEFGHDLADWNGCVPIIIKLRSFADQALPRPDQFLSDPAGPMTGPVPEEWTHRELDSGRALLLVDGVDELSTRQRPKVRQWLRSLLHRYPGTRIVVTSRPAAAGTRWLTTESFASVDLENMNPPDVREFLERWHKALIAAAENDGTLPFSWKEIEAHRRSLLSQLDAHAHLRNLARSPLMCGMLCALHLDRGGDVPRDRKSLYEAALEMLLDRRETARDIPSSQEIELSYRSKLTLLQDLAFWLNLNARSEIQKQLALDLIDRKLETMPRAAVTADNCLHYLLERSGVIREPVEGRVDFVHRTFQEFLAACEAADNGHIGLLTSKAHSDQWRETIVMAVGLVNRPNRAELLNGILDRADHARGRTRRRLRLLAATCRESVHELPADVLDRLNENVRTLVPPRNLEESRSLATVGESILDQLPTDLTTLSKPQAAACVLTAALVNGPRSLELLHSFARDGRAEVQDELIEAWPLYDPGEYATLVLADAPLHNGSVLVEDVRLIPHLRELAHLKATYLDIRVSNERNLAFTASAPRLQYLRVETDHDLTLDGISNHPGVRDVILVNFTGEIKGLHGLAHLQSLKYLFINQHHGLADISFLNELPEIKYLRLGELSEAVDVSPLATLNQLRSLTLDGGDQEAALMALSNPENLQSLNLSGGSGVPIQLVTERFRSLKILLFSDVYDFDPRELPRLTR